MHVVGRNDEDHADAEVEDVGHLVVVDVAEPLDLVEDARRLPRVPVDDGITAVGNA